MLKSDSFLVLDFGAVNLKLAEFEPNEAGNLRLKQYGFKSLGRDGLQESTRNAAIQRALKELLSEKSFGSKNVNVCAPGFHVFSKFVKLPAVDSSKVTQIIRYEAQQNVPFPLDEVVWDYQILGTVPQTNELEVMLVAIKSDVVEQTLHTVEAGGLRLQLVDVSAAALCNAFRYNYGDLEGCTMLLDIGAKTSSLLFFEGNNVYSRGINIGANTITQDFSKESKLGFDEAEQMKIAEGFVGLGGAYEEPESPHQAAISKIARQVMTRLHIQVNQTIQFYRGQQGGKAPERLFLSGGASSMPFTAQFFAEKLNLSVDYFNPFRNVQIDPALNLEEMVKVGHCMGELVGLGLRGLARCPVELNLMPNSYRKRKEFGTKKPYLIGAAACLLLFLFAYGYFYAKIAEAKRNALERLDNMKQPYVTDSAALTKGLNVLRTATNNLDQYSVWLEERSYWASVMGELRRIMLEVEASAKQQFNLDAGLWVETFEPVEVPTEDAKIVASQQIGTAVALRPRAGTRVRTVKAAGVRATEATVDAVKLKCRAVDLTKRGGSDEANSKLADANSKLADLLESGLKASSLFSSSTNTALESVGKPEGYTFQIVVTLGLKRTIKL